MRVGPLRMVVIVALLTAVWVALWGDLTVANVVGGVAASALCLIVVPLEPPATRGTLRPLAAAGYGLFFAKELLVANLVVAVEVVTPGNRDNEGIVAMPVAPSCSPTTLMIVVNSIGLTPGTVVVDIAEEPLTLYVHVLHLDDRASSLAKLFEFQRRALDAWGTDAARVELRGLIAESRSADAAPEVGS